MFNKQRHNIATGHSRKDGSCSVLARKSTEQHTSRHISGTDLALLWRPIEAQHNRATKLPTGPHKDHLASTANVPEWQWRHSNPFEKLNISTVSQTETYTQTSKAKTKDARQSGLRVRFGCSNKVKGMEVYPVPRYKRSSATLCRNCCFGGKAFHSCCFSKTSIFARLVMLSSCSGHKP